VRPESLIFEAFGSYLERTVIDFSKVGRDGIFLICGSTGGGKTTLLDAISIALYGRATGSLRGDKWRLLRCKLADRAVDTYVEFIFSLGEERYRFVRRWRMSKSQGEDLLKAQENACYRWQGNDWGEPLASRSASAVDAEAERILGLSHDQFIKVICLPQGEFRELLTTSSDERTKIFERLFGTARWKLIIDASARRCTALDNQLKELRAGMEGVLRANEQENPTLLRMAADEAVKERDALRQQTEDLSVQLEAANKNLNDALAIDGKFVMLDRARGELAELEKHRLEIEEISAALSRHEQLSSLYERFCVLKTAREEQAAVCERYEKCESHAAETARELESARLAGEQLDDLRSKLDSVRDELVLLRSLKEKSDQLSAANSEIVRCEGEIARCDAQLAALSEKTDQLQQRIAKGRQLIDECDSAIAQTQEVTAKAAAAQKNVELFAGLSQLDDSRNAALRQLEKAEQEHAAIERQLNEAKVQLAGLEALVSADAAYALSLTLQEGQPCPVCGSAAHPMLPCPPENIPDKAQLDAARSALADAQAQTERSTEILSRHRAAYTLAAEQYDQAQRQCNDLSITAAQAAEQLNAAESELEAINHQHKAKDQYQKLLAQLESEQSEARESIEQLTHQRAEHQSALSSAEGKRDAIIGELSGCAVTADVLGQRIAESEQQAVQLDRQIKEITERIGSAGVADAAAQADFKAAAESLNAITTRTAALEADYLSQCRIKDVDPGCEISAQLLGDETAEDYRTRIEQYKLDYAAAQKSVRDLEAETAQQQRPKTDELRSIYEALLESSQQLTHRHGEATARAQQLVSAAESVESSAREYERLTEMYAAEKRISECLRGTNDRKTPIDQFVAGLLLDEVIGSANNYWQRLSRGQYSLRRSVETSGRERHQGVNFEVIDTNIGGVRAIATLSGGELFLASLSLAFGLSDVVQGFSGGLRLESIFIDEGFGSLDRDTLDVALKSISEIREGRIIGIISHVDELRARITSRIEVSKGETGSRATIIC